MRNFKQGLWAEKQRQQRRQELRQMIELRAQALQRERALIQAVAWARLAMYCPALAPRLYELYPSLFVTFVNPAEDMRCPSGWREAA